MGELDMGDVGSMDRMAESSTMFWGASALAAVSVPVCRAFLLLFLAVVSSGL